MRITVKSHLDPNLNESLKIYFITPGVDCGKMTMYIITITIEQEVTLKGISMFASRVKILVLRPFQEYCVYIELIINQR